jgi:carboxyl-terminal processing protease
LPESAVVASVVDVDGDAVTYRARGVAYAYPIVVLVDRSTASAAELFAGSLRAHGRALVAGERTYGKSTAFAAIGGALREVGHFLLPDGSDIGGTGVEPDKGCVSWPMTTAKANAPTAR